MSAYENKICPFRATEQLQSDRCCDKSCAWYDERYCQCAILMLAQAEAFIVRK
nr:MAG TPA: hypothetical protein [Caudoviricetes sp.]